ncbi:MAG: ATP synthase F1 subunit delta [Flavobacteriaceae bacterium]|nr:ATP synthase F1 subunit delta [Flavobacteriaceae bacterium]
MSGSRTALRYAKAILSTAVEQKVEHQINDEMKLIDETVDGSKELQSLLKSPVVKSSVKKEVLQKIFEGKISALSNSLIDVLIENNRLPLLDKVASSYTIIYDHLKGKEVANVTTAVPLDDALKQKVLEKVKELTGKEASIKNIVDESIIGGFILRVGDKQYDASIANKFQMLRRQFDNQTYISKI